MLKFTKLVQTPFSETCLEIGIFVAMFQVNLSLDQSICLEPKISIEMISDKEYSFELSTSLWISSQPLEQEPYEQQTVYVGESRVAPNAGEGLFAKRKIPEGMLFVTLYVQKPSQLSNL